MRRVDAYETQDGRLWRSEGDARTYETTLLLATKVEVWIDSYTQITSSTLKEDIVASIIRPRKELFEALAVD